MSKIKKVFELIKEHKLFETILLKRHAKKIKRCAKYIGRSLEDDKKYLAKYGKFKLGYDFNLDNPQTFCEKLNWLKLYDRKDIYTTMVDKYEAKKFVADRIGEEHIIPTYGVWDHFDDIDFDKLPNQFVLKCTHDSGSIVVVKDKNNFDKKKAKKQLEKCLKRDYYKTSAEWPYKNVKRRIIAEKYLSYLGNPDSVEYKTTCFNGKVGFVTICTGAGHAKLDERTDDQYTVDFKRMPWHGYYKNSTKELNKPAQWNELMAICEKLSEGVPCLRVDCYIIDGEIYFAELTFFTTGGFIDFNPKEWDLKLGEMLELPNKNGLTADVNQNIIKTKGNEKNVKN